MKNKVRELRQQKQNYANAYGKDWKIKTSEKYD